MLGCITLENHKFKINNSSCPITKGYGKHILVITTKFVDLISVLENIFDNVPPKTYDIRLINETDASSWPSCDQNVSAGELYYSWENFRIPASYF